MIKEGILNWKPTTIVDRKANETLAHQVIQAAVNAGITEFCICPGSRNSPLLQILNQQSTLKVYFSFEERSAAYFALGRIKSTRQPMAVMTTSGTASAELFPAAIEGYYSGIPLLLITADRPRRFRESGAPQSIEQLGLFGQYARFCWDVSSGEPLNLQDWDQKNPAHLNVCFEEPERQWEKKEYICHPVPSGCYRIPISEICAERSKFQHLEKLDCFLNKVNYPLVVVSTLSHSSREEVVQFLLRLNAPVYLEAISGLREEPRLHHLRITRCDNLWKNAGESGYPIDGILRIGGVPTIRLWRDLEDKEGSLEVLSMSDQGFTGLSWGVVLGISVEKLLKGYVVPKPILKESHFSWMENDKKYLSSLRALLHEEPFSEPALVYQLSQVISRQSRLYLGNSLPIREWDLAASHEYQALDVYASRGVNGIEGQISTFLGLSSAKCDNWGIFGDLTALYDMAGPWILSQIPEVALGIVVVNNGGGKIFAKMYESESLQNCHGLNFEPLAKMWSLPYEKWTKIPTDVSSYLKRHKHWLIEIVPDNAATDRFWKKLAKI